MPSCRWFVGVSGLVAVAVGPLACGHGNSAGQPPDESAGGSDGSESRSGTSARGAADDGRDGAMSPGDAAEADVAARDGAATGAIAAREAGSPDATSAFVHPGLLHTRADLDRMKSMVEAGTQPYTAGYDVFKADSKSSSSYAMQGPFPETGRNPDVHQAETEDDSSAAYQNAIMWYITGVHAYADKAIQILDGWSSTLKTISGSDAILAASLDGFKFVNAAEIIRYTNAGWSAADVASAENLFKNVFYPVIQNFATFANGNWSTGCIKAMMGIAVFTDDHAMFGRAIDWYDEGPDNGSLVHYIIDETGQCQESGRDQQHAQLGIAHLAEASEVGWHQGFDMYGAANDRLLDGFEYTASYNLGNDVPFQPYTDTTGMYPHTAISPPDRCQLRPIYEMVYNHYVNRRGVSCPRTQQAAEKLRPEGAAPNADHPGFGTLLFTKPPGSP